MTPPDCLDLPGTTAPFTDAAFLGTLPSGSAFTDDALTDDAFLTGITLLDGFAIAAAFDRIGALAPIGAD